MASTSDLTRWTGWDPTRTAASPADHEALAPPPGETRYELLALAGRGFRPPGILTVTDLPEGDDGSDGDEARRGALRRSWAVLYRRIAETAPARDRPFAIYLLGVDPPADATDADLAGFNDFYTNVHLVEVAERRHALRAVRFEHVRTLAAPANGAPRYLATYEVDEAGASQRRHVGPPYSKGPDVWQRHSTPWRLWYRRVDTLAHG